MPEDPRQIVPMPQQPMRSERPPEDDEINLSELVGALYEGRWLILACALVVTAIGTGYALMATPIYKADALIQVEEKSGGIKGLDVLSEMFEAEASGDAEIELIRSRSVVSQVIEQLHLDIKTEPKYFPFFGQAEARRHGTGSLAEPSLSPAWAWGGEKLTVTQLDVPEHLEGLALTLTAGDDGTFTLETPEGETLVSGRAGEATKTGEIRIKVDALVANPGTEFTVVKRSPAAAIDDFLAALSVRERGKKTGIIELEMQGPDRKLIREALDEVMAAYVRQNVERKAAEAQKTLEFVRTRLPQQKEALDLAEVALNEYRKETGKLDLGIEANAIVDRAAEVEKGLTELTLQESEMRSRFTASHPAMRALKKKLASLQSEKRELDTLAKSLPENQLNSVRLVRDVTVANELYVLLLNKAQELDLVKSGTVGNVRVVDAALVKPRAVKPRKSMIVALSLILGLGAGVALTFLRRALKGGVQDPELIEQALGMTVYASVPHSVKQEQMYSKAEKGRTRMIPLAQSDANDLAIESLRSLRTSLQFSLSAAKNNLIVISGSRPGVGKSFISVNLAHVLADAGKRVLLVDADLRKGQLHRYFGVERDNGFADVVAGELALEAAIQQTESKSLSFLPSGKIPPNPSELLSSPRAKELLERLSSMFDLVVMDAPPILAVTDAAELARHAGVNLLIAKAGLHPIRELALTVSRFQQVGVRPNGFVFNAVPMSGGFNGYGAGRYYYQYEYR